MSGVDIFVGDEDKLLPRDKAIARAGDREFMNKEFEKKGSIRLDDLGSSSLPWKIFLYTLTTVQICFSIAFTTFWLTICRPLSDWWDLTHDGHNCASTQTVARGFHHRSKPQHCQRRYPLHRAHHVSVERILACALVGMGSFASIASIVKLVAVLKWSRQPKGTICGPWPRI
ncbi:hypothetical protein B0T25DRAFT_578481 [Lasiosphaeria hispida]|uniref:Uncharacterized protein n=1 Tax=Lasiosphaeria hispida TaxID=260671 RepID=A0AAJ0HSR9_9PEZI|nr:hypothetical protein B0T25DRAFT_578481 [Lasiosphaeria hispida]